MIDDDVLRGVTAAARAEHDDAAESRWTRLAEGTLPEPERAALEAADPARYALYAPLDAAAHDALAARALAEMTAEAPATAGTNGATAHANGATAHVSAGAPVVSLWTRRLAVAAPLAAAAAIVLALGRGSFGGSATAPDYTAVWATDEHEKRGADAPAPGALHVQSGPRFELQLRPVARTAGDLSARAVIVRGETITPWRGALEVAPGGAVRLEGATSTVFPAGPGEYTLIVAVAPPDALPAADADLLAPSPSRWRTVRGTVLVR